MVVKSIKVSKSNLPRMSVYLTDYFWQDLHYNLAREYSREVADFIVATKRQDISNMIDKAVEGAHVRLDLK